MPTDLRLKKDKCPVMPLPLSISFRKGSRRPEADPAGIWRLPKIRMAASQQGGRNQRADMDGDTDGGQDGRHGVAGKYDSL